MTALPAIPTDLPRTTLTTARLILRPTRPDDARTAYGILSDWDISKWLRPAPYPPDPDQVAAWFAGHATEWAHAHAFRFAICLDGALIGVVDLDGIEPGVPEATLGYWLDRNHWGQGYAFEAARAAIGFAFGPMGCAALNSGHAAEHPASGRILKKLGFQRASETEKLFVAQGAMRPYIGYRLPRPVT